MICDVCNTNEADTREGVCLECLETAAGSLNDLDWEDTDE